MTPTVEVMRSDELLARRSELLSGCGMTEDELRQSADVYSLTPELAAVLDEIEEIDYLLRD